jgi:hypothetical protein
MMRDRLSSELKSAMRAQSRRRLATLRLILAAVKDRDLAAQGAGRDALSDTEILDVLQKMVKQRKESAETYKGAGRMDLHDQEVEEIGIIREFLPKAMGAGEARIAIEALIAEIGAEGIKDMGRTMAALKERYAGRMDFAQASGVVKELLK